MIIGRPYKKEDLDGVIACLKRNFVGLQEKAPQEIAQQISPLTHHEWVDEKKNENRYNYGMVLLDEDEIVGYLGGIGAERSIGQKTVSYLNLSTWAVDKGYRGNFFSVVEDMYTVPGVITDLSPNKASVFFESRLFGMSIDETGLVRLLPIPYIEKEKCKITYIEDGVEIGDEQIRKEYEDHKKYAGLGLIRVESTVDICYVFYRKMQFNGEWIRVLKISNAKVFADNCHEISWHIVESEIYNNITGVSSQFAEILKRSQNKMWIAVECEKRFFQNCIINHPAYTEVKIKRLYRDNAGIGMENVDFLYTEYSFLN